MRSDRKVIGKRFRFYLGMVLLPLFFLFFTPITGIAREGKEEKKEALDVFSYLIENGSKMIRENEFGRVLSEIQALTPEKRSDFRVRVLENFAFLKSYVITKKWEHGKKWQLDYKAMVYTRNMTATLILVDLLKDSDPYMRAFTARALGYLGDQTSLEPLKKARNSDPNPKVRSRAKEAYLLISGEKVPEEPSKEN